MAQQALQPDRVLLRRLRGGERVENFSEEELDRLLELTGGEELDRLTSEATGESRSLPERLLSVLPPALGAITGLAAAPSGPGAFAAAGLGQMGGEGLRQAISQIMGLEPPAELGETLEGLSREALLGAGSEMAGVPITAAMQRLVGPLLTRGFRPALADLTGPGRSTAAVNPEELYELLDTLRELKIPVGKGATRQVARLRRASGATTSAILKEATEAGVTIPRGEVLGGAAQRLVDEFSSRGLVKQADEFKVLGDLVLNFSQQYRVLLTPLEVKKLKKASQELSAPVLQMERWRGNALAASIGERFTREIAKEAKAALEAMPAGFGERVAASEAKTSRLIPAVRAMRRAEFRQAIPPTLALSDIASILRALGVSPRNLTKMGFILDDPTTQAFMRQFPRVAIEGGRQVVGAEARTPRMRLEQR